MDVDPRGVLSQVTAAEVMDELRRCSEQSAWAVNLVRIAAERIVRRRTAEGRRQ